MTFKLPEGKLFDPMELRGVIIVVGLLLVYWGGFFSYYFFIG